MAEVSLEGENAISLYSVSIQSLKQGGFVCCKYFLFDSSFV